MITQIITDVVVPTPKKQNYLQEILDWVMHHLPLVGMVFACLFIAWLLRSVWTALPKPVLLVLVVLVAIGLGIFSVNGIKH